AGVLPPVNLNEPGWKIRRGQAVWKPNKSAPEIAGELTFASNPDGRAVLEFTKTPFPIAVAQVTSNQWQIEFPAQQKRFSGRGRPPARIGWLQLCLAL